MSIIEQAAKRLEELERASMSVPGERDEVMSEELSPGERHFTPEVPEAESQIGHQIGQTVERAGGREPAKSDANVESSHRIDIDLVALAGRNILTAESSRSQLADEIRVIKRPLLENALGNRGSPNKKGNLIMVTSSLPGEGKTFTSINLAMSIAMEMDLRVLLVDADVSRRALLDYLGLPVTKGLLDVLLDKNIDLAEVLLHTNIEKLSILPGGNSYRHATELLASESMGRLIDEMASRYSDRIIIFDSPPLLVTTESRVLAGHMGQIVMVVEAGKTTHAAVQHALKTIESCPEIHMMLNKSVVTDYGGYGYGYGYGYGSY